MQEVKTGDLVWVFWDDYATCWGTYRVLSPKRGIGADWVAIADASDTVYHPRRETVFTADAVVDEFKRRVETSEKFSPEEKALKRAQIATLEEHARRVLDGLETKPSHR